MSVVRLRDGHCHVIARWRMRKDSDIGIADWEICNLPSKSGKIEANLNTMLVSLMTEYRCQAMVDNLPRVRLDLHCAKPLTLISIAILSSLSEAFLVDCRSEDVNFPFGFTQMMFDSKDYVRRRQRFALSNNPSSNQRKVERSWHQVSIMHRS